MLMLQQAQLNSRDAAANVARFLNEQRSFCLQSVLSQLKCREQLVIKCSNYQPLTVFNSENYGTIRQ